MVANDSPVKVSSTNYSYKIRVMGDLTLQCWKPGTKIEFIKSAVVHSIMKTTLLAKEISHIYGKDQTFTVETLCNDCPALFFPGHPRRQLGHALVADHAGGFSFRRSLYDRRRNDMGGKSLCTGSDCKNCFRSVFKHYRNLQFQSMADYRGVFNCSSGNIHAVRPPRPQPQERPGCCLPRF